MKYLVTPVVLGAVAASLLILGQASGNEARESARAADVIAADNPVYVKECGSCHMAYSPGLLPARSWKAVMSKLDNHFGDNAELDSATHGVIVNYLANNSADGSSYRRSQRIMRSLDNNVTPLRITELPYFRREHHEIPPRVFTSRPELKSLSQCNACHSQAAKGSFAEREISLPVVGRWED